MELVFFMFVAKFYQAVKFDNEKEVQKTVEADTTMKMERRYIQLVSNKTIEKKLRANFAILLSSHVFLPKNCSSIKEMDSIWRRHRLNCLRKEKRRRINMEKLGAKPAYAPCQGIWAPRSGRLFSHNEHTSCSSLLRFSVLLPHKHKHFHLDIHLTTMHG